IHHSFMQAVMRLYNARSIRKDNLKIFSVNNTSYAVAGSLCLRSHNGKFHARKSIHQGRLSNVRLAGNADKAGFVIHLQYFSSGGKIRTYDLWVMRPTS